MGRLTAVKILRDGTVVAVHPIALTDADRLIRFHESLSTESIRMRFFSGHPHLRARDAERFTTVDHDEREALVALLDDVIIAVGRYERLDNGVDAEVAFVVAERRQGFGLGTMLLHDLAALARSSGIRRFVADTLAENQRMLAVFMQSGLAIAKSTSQGVVSVSMEL